MNKLSTTRRAKVLDLLVEGVSMRAITRLEGVGINTVTRLIDAAGDACAAYHDEHVRGIRGNRRIECDEAWAFYAKERNVSRANAAPKHTGDAWTFSAIDAESKLVVSYLVGNRDGQSAISLMDDLRTRLDDRPQVSTDGLAASKEAVEGAVQRRRGLRPSHQGIRQVAGERRRTAIQPAGLRQRQETSCRRQPRHAEGQHVIRRAKQSHDAAGQSPIHAIDQRPFEEGREARCDGQLVLLALQLLPDSQDVARHARDGSRSRNDGARLRMDRRIDRRPSAEAETPQDVPEAGRLNIARGTIWAADKLSPSGGKSTTPA